MFPIPAPLRPVLLLLLLATGAAAAPGGPLLLDAVRAGEAIVAVGERGLVLRRAAPGTDWERHASGVDATLTGVSFADAERGWATGHDGLVLGTADGGVTWTAVHRAEDRRTSYLDVCALSSDRAIAIGGFGAYLETNDGGQSWRSRSILDEDVHLNRITRTPDGRLFIAGEMGTLLRSTDGGRTWDRLETGNEGSFYGVLSLENGDLLAYGLRGRVYRSTDGGDHWERVETGSTGLLLTGVQLDDGTIVLAGQARVCLASRDGGRTFVTARHDVAAIAELIVEHDRELLTFGEAGVHALTVP